MQSPITRLVACAALAWSATAALAQVTPPPLPPGSNLVRPEPGMNEPERKRAIRAHHNKFHHGRDYTRDDSIYPMTVNATVAPQRAGQPATGALGAGKPGVVQDGKGTGPAREKTDRGASGWFYGTDKK
ncbi:hypothetical protein LZ009_08225 [Ramlibacter sp. XY19]|uniref:hypothetical protein n=1 Tax=Ramlibacter paludis TaxID=2908000 RepID=UPI0023DADCAD|nr:hypothetical protein [Ramlibacter paludis]MCG2592768.1 hypothetical protein [Ramlibacter paludis]